MASSRNSIDVATRVGSSRDVHPVRVVLVEWVDAAALRPLQVELLGEQDRCVRADEVAHRLEEARVVRPPVERGAEVRARFDPVYDIRVAFPLDDHVAREVRVEDVAAGLQAMPAPVADEVVDQALARVEHLVDLGRGEHRRPHHVAVGGQTRPVPACDRGWRPPDRALESISLRGYATPVVAGPQGGARCRTRRPRSRTSTSSRRTVGSRSQTRWIPMTSRRSSTGAR